MNKKYGMSAIGLSIVIVLILAFVMILSAPNMVNDTQKPQPKNNTQDIYYEMQSLENKLNDRINKLDRKIDNIQDISNSNSYPKNRYICKIDGGIDEYGNKVPISEGSDIKKFIFTCEYRN